MPRGSTTGALPGWGVGSDSTTTTAVLVYEATTVTRNKESGEETTAVAQWK